MPICNVHCIRSKRRKGLIYTGVDLPVVKKGLKVCFDNPFRASGRRYRGLIVGRITKIVMSEGARTLLVIRCGAFKRTRRRSKNAKIR